LAKSKKKKTNKIARQVFGIILLSMTICLAIYIIYVVATLFANPTDNFIIQDDILTAEESTVGYVIREEKIVESKKYENGIVKIKGEGEKVAVGETVFRYYTENEEQIKNEIQNLDEQIQDALKGQIELPSSDIEALNHRIEEKLRDLNNKNSIQEIEESKKDIDAYISKKAKIAGELSPAGSYINNLIKQRTSLEQKIYNTTEYVVADTSGVVSYRIDNLEDVLTIDNIENLNKEMLEELELKTGKIVPSSDNRVKIINNFECYIAVISEAKEAKSAEKGDNVYLRLSDFQEIKAKIEFIKKERSEALIILKITEGVEKLIDYRKVSLDLIWWKKEGLKAPKTSIIYENGLSYIVRVRAGISSKILVKVEQENDNYCIIRNYKTSELEKMGYTAEEIDKMKQVSIYDEILVNPSIEEL